MRVIHVKFDLNPATRVPVVWEEMLFKEIVDRQ